METKKKDIISVSLICVIILIIVLVFFVSFDQSQNNNNSVAGLSGTYEYSTSGTYNNGTLAYTGTYVISLNNGDCTYANRTLTDNLNTGSVSLGTSSIKYIPASPWPMIPPIGYVDKAPQNNSLLQGLTFYGLITLTIPNHGSLSLHEYYSYNNNCYYYSDNNGIIYSIVVEGVSLAHGTSGGYEIVYTLN